MFPLLKPLLLPIPKLFFAVIFAHVNVQDLSWIYLSKITQKVTSSSTEAATMTVAAAVAAAAATANRDDRGCIDLCA